MKTTFNTTLKSLVLVGALLSSSSLLASGADTYKKCAGCHGQKAEKKALGKSQAIGGWEATKIETALNGYKAGTYGGAMKGLMKGQVASLDEVKIKELAEYISTLK